jgi:hypothetical protein
MKANKLLLIRFVMKRRAIITILRTRKAKDIYRQKLLMKI